MRRGPRRQRGPARPSVLYRPCFDPADRKPLGAQVWSHLQVLGGFGDKRHPKLTNLNMLHTTETLLEIRVLLLARPPAERRDGHHSSCRPHCSPGQPHGLRQLYCQAKAAHRSCADEPRRRPHIAWSPESGPTAARLGRDHSHSCQHSQQWAACLCDHTRHGKRYGADYACHRLC